MRAFPVFLLSYFLITSIGIAQGMTARELNSALQANAGGIYTIPAGLHVIDETIIVPKGTTLQGTRGQNGETLTILKLADNLPWEPFKPMIEASSNTKFFYLNFDGNSMNQARAQTKNGKNWGQGTDNIIKFAYGNGLEVAYCNFYNNLGDGVRATNSENIRIHHNSAWKGGHDVFFIIRSEGAWIWDNNIQPRVNSGIRLMDAKHVRIYNNYIKFVESYDGISYDAGPSLQIQQDLGEMNDIEICGNVIINSCGPGLWLVGKSGNSEELWLHDNVFEGSGLNNGISWVGGIIASGYDGALIEKNVFDGSYRAGICFYAVSSAWATSATATVKDNIITNSRQSNHGGEGGYGIENTIGSQTVNCVSNVYWNNAAVNHKGSITCSGCIEADPKTTQMTSGFVWTGSEWQGPQVNPKKMGEIPVGPDGNNSYSNLEPITDEEIHAFDDIFDILDVQMLDKAIDSNTTPKNDVEETTQGMIKGGIDIVGYNQMVKLDGEYYIKSPEDAIIISKAENVASHPISLDKKISLTPRNGFLTSDLECHAVYKIAKKHQKKVMGIPVTTLEFITKEETQTFTCTKPMPKIFNESKAGTAYIKILNQTANPQTQVYVHPNLDTVKIEFRYNDTESFHNLRVGLVERSDNNVQYVNMTKAEYWENANGTGRVGNNFVIPAAVDPHEVPEKIKITYYDVYGNAQEVENYNITQINSTGDLRGYFNPVLIILAVVFGTLSYATYRNFCMFRRRW